MEYTKPPWKLVTRNPLPGSFKINPFYQIERNVKMHGIPIDVDITAMRSGNGKLIAKAPEMYESIKKLIALWNDLDSEELIDTLNEMTEIIEEIER